MNHILETERLNLRLLTLKDSAFIVELVNSSGWIKYIGDRNIKTIEQATHYLEEGPLKSYKEHGFGLWLVEDKVTEKSIGMCGLLKRDYLTHADIGFAFLPAYIGKGFGHEAALATVLWAKYQINLDALCAITMPDNHASTKLLKKIGMEFQKSFTPPASEEVLHLYRISFSIKSIIIT